MTKYGMEHPNSSKDKIDYEFDEWYQENYGNPKYCKSKRGQRYYELKRVWKDSKKFYSKSESKTSEDSN